MTKPREVRKEVPTKPCYSSGAAPPDAMCFYRKAKGHWKINCKKYHEDKRKSRASGKGRVVTNVIGIFLTSPHSKSWVFDTRSIAHVCNSMKGLEKVGLMERNEVQMRVTNDIGIAALAI
jgi:hypothetical protein